MKTSVLNRIATSSFLVSLLMLSACEGESRPFEESAEVVTLGLTGVQITPPANSQPEIVISSGQRLQLDIAGISSNNSSSIELSGTNRSWRSSNTSVLTVSENGLVTGSAVGAEKRSALVSVSIGGVDSNNLEIFVSNATVDSIKSVNSTDGIDELELCLPGEYYAVGVFTDGSDRTLTDTDVDFTLSDDSLANASLNQTGNVARINANTAGAVTLVVKAGDLPPESRQLTVLNNLTSIAITPDPAAVDKDKTVQLTARGTYTGSSVPASEEEMDTDTQDVPATPETPADTVTPVAPADTKTEDITANVEWQINSGGTSASVGNSEDDKGLVSGLEAGIAQVQAGCGIGEPGLLSVTVNDVSNTSSSQLSFNFPESGTLLVLRVGESRILQVSRGSTFDEDNTVTNGVEFLASENSGEAIDTSQLSTGRIVAKTAGESARITATIRDDNGQIEASGSITVTVRASVL